MTDVIRQTIRLTRYTTEVLRDYAVPMWPELDGNVTGLINKVIADWHRMRTENGGGRMARIAQLEERMALVERRLGMSDYDTDHG